MQWEKAYIRQNTNSAPSLHLHLLQFCWKNDLSCLVSVHLLNWVLKELEIGFLNVSVVSRMFLRILIEIISSQGRDLSDLWNLAKSIGT